MNGVCYRKGLRRWHAQVGVCAFVFFLLLAISGVVLNHGHALGLDARNVRVGWLARWYGFNVDQPLTVFQAGHHVLASAGRVWVIDGAPADDEAALPVGMVELGSALYIAFPDTLYVYTADRRLVEKITAHALPATPVSAIGIAGGQIAIRARDKTFVSTDSVSWTSDSASQVTWSVGRTAPASLENALRARLLPPVPLTRLIADIHSGRFFGRYGALAVDVLALALMILGLTGAWLFARGRHNGTLPRPHGDS